MKQDGIVVVAALRANRAASEGHEPAIVNEVLGTGRHLVSTTLTTIGGFVPLFLAGGFWPPLAAAIAGGVGGTTIMAFFFVPAAYAFLVRRGLLKPESRVEEHPTPAVVPTAAAARGRPLAEVLLAPRPPLVAVAAPILNEKPGPRLGARPSN